MQIFPDIEAYTLGSLAYCLFPLNKYFQFKYFAAGVSVTFISRIKKETLLNIGKLLPQDDNLLFGKLFKLQNVLK